MVLGADRTLSESEGDQRIGHVKRAEEIKTLAALPGGQVVTLSAEIGREKNEQYIADLSWRGVERGLRRVVKTQFKSKTKGGWGGRHLKLSPLYGPT